MEGRSAWHRWKASNTIRRQRSWGSRSFLKRFNVASCARSDTGGMDSANVGKEHKMDRREEGSMDSREHVAVATKEITNNSIEPVAADRHRVVAVEKANEAVIDRVGTTAEELLLGDHGGGVTYITTTNTTNYTPRVSNVEAKEAGRGSAIANHGVLQDEKPEGRRSHAMGHVDGNRHATVADINKHDDGEAVGDVDHEATKKKKGSAVGVVVNGKTSSTCTTTTATAYGVGLGKANAMEVDVAAMRIQALFRGHLARRAFGALKSLVKLQALARGAYVRRQAQVAKSCMNSLARLHARLRDRQQLMLKDTADP